MVDEGSFVFGAPREHNLIRQEIADFLRAYLSSVRRWSRGGKLRAYKVGDRGDWRYWHQDVLDFLRIPSAAD